MKKNKLVILTGPPGSGKGAQTLLLSGRKKMIHLEVSKLLEKKFLNISEDQTINIDGKDYSLLEQKKLWSDGYLCEDGFVAFVVREAVEKTKRGTDSILLDGYPRTITQAQLAIPFLFSFYESSDILVVSLEVSEEESIKRNSKRRVCTLMRHSIIDHEETRNLTICPLDGSLLERRVLDKEETIKVRLKVFRETTAPVIDYFEKEGMSVARIDGMGTISDVYKRVLLKLEEFGL